MMMVAEKNYRRIVKSNYSLNRAFWNEYSVLWLNSKDKSPFQSPEILKYFSSGYANQVIAIRMYRDDKLLAATLLRKVKGVYSFLSELKADTNYFVFHEQCSEEDISYFFTGFFDLVKSNEWAVMLNQVPAKADHYPVFEQCGFKSRLFFHPIVYSVCPILEYRTPAEIHDSISRTRTLRNNANNLKSKLKAEFEVLTGDEDLDKWVEEFCAAHTLRWEHTPTPSVYSETESRFFLLKCLQSWSADNVLVRFAVKVKGKRIGFHICLTDGHSLIGHSQTFHPDFHKLSPAKVLLLTISEWMIKKNINVFDFGNGNEKYKYNYVNQEQVLKRIFISSKSNFAYIAKAKLIGWVKNNPALYKFYQGKIKGILNRFANKNKKAPMPESGTKQAFLKTAVFKKMESCQGRVL